MLSLKYSYSKQPSYISKVFITSVLSNIDSLREPPNHCVRILWLHQAQLVLGDYLMQPLTNLKKIHLFEINVFQLYLHLGPTYQPKVENCFSEFLSRLTQRNLPHDKTVF